ncbi:MAG TPA: endolytic transglycosylase MltG [Acidiferrobacter sp.]|nr:endolytic transglycosylase MltG [Acidiferrobacter sp.]
MRRFLKILVLSTVLFSPWYFLADRPLHPGPQVFRLQTGTTMRSFADMLAHRHVIDFADSFVALARLEGAGSALKAGDYQFGNPTTPMRILQKVVQGRVIEYPLVLVPGWTFAQIRGALAKAPHLRDDIKGLSQRQIAALLHETVSLQGSFFPDTYFYTDNATASSLLQRAHQRMEKLLQTSWQARARGLPIKTSEQGLILASLIEKETAKAGERRAIAGVFVNRLRLGMRLQTDPTVIFALGRRYHGVLTSTDLMFPSPYNTYLHYGLPPTPIGLVSSRALYAALHPATTKALYFVATGHGGHVFSDTLKAQDQEIRTYELNGHP